MINKEKALKKLKEKIHFTIYLYELKQPYSICEDCNKSKAIYRIKFTIQTKKNKFYNKYLLICDNCLINLLNNNL